MAKVGFLYTIGLLLMALTVMSLALFIAEVQKESNEKVAELLKYERLYELDTSINEGFAEIFRVASGISIIHNNITQNVTFIKETLPNSNNTIFSQNMSSWERFLNKTASLPTENITIYRQNIETVKSRLPILILPYNATYDHVPNFGGDTIRLKPVTTNIPGYNISVISPIDVLSSSPWRTTSGSDFIIKIKISGPTTNIIKNQKISKTGMSYLQVRNSANTANLLNISINNSQLYIDRYSGVARIWTTTGIILNITSKQTGLTQFMYPKRMYNVTLANFSLKTSSHVLLASLKV